MRKLLTLAILLCCAPAFATSAFDAVAHQISTGSAASIPSFNLTIGAISNGAVYVGVSCAVVASCTGMTVTVGGVSATLKQDGGAQGGVSSRALAFCLATGSTTGAQAIVVAWTGGNTNAGAIAMSFSGADQTTPCNNPNLNHSAATGPTSVAITSVSGDLTVDTVSCDNGSTPTAPTQTSRFAGNAGSQVGYAASTGPGTGTTTHQWTTGSSWEAVGVNIKQASAGGVKRMRGSVVTR